MGEKKKNTVFRVFQAAQCKSIKYVFGVFCSSASILCTAIPFYTVYRIMRIFLEASLNQAAVDSSQVWFWVGVTLASIAAGILLSVAGSVICHACAFRALYDLRMRILGHMGKLNLGFFTGGQSGAVQKTMSDNIEKMEGITGKKFGDKENPLLVSVRSGARASMPGMMDTILNLGLNEEVVEVIAKKSNNPRWAWDCYRRFIQMYSDVVMEVGKKYFEQLIDQMKEKKGVEQDVELTAEDLKELANQFKAEYKSKIGTDFPTDPKEQLMGAIKAVFRSWDNPRANVYRRDNDIPYSWGTAVNVQMMAFGNMGDTSGTGVAFTRNPATGEKKLFGEFLMNAQGEDVVAGVRTPQHIDELKKVMPEVYEQFVGICNTLENHYRDMQDMEFTIEDKKLYMLQTRNGKRTAAGCRIEDRLRFG